MNQSDHLHAAKELDIQLAKKVGHSGLTQTAEKAEILGRIVATSVYEI